MEKIDRLYVLLERNDIDVDTKAALCNIRTGECKIDNQ